jgi:nucleoporin POM152
VSYESSNRSHILNPTCQGDSGHIDIDLTGLSRLVFSPSHGLTFCSGRPPFHILYDILEATIDGAKLPYNPTFYSTHNQSQLQLQTSNVGRVFYEISQLGDAIYPLANYRGLSIPRSERLLFEQQVLLHPSAHFKTQDRLSYRLYDAFLPTSRPSEGAVILEGIPPFQLQLAIRHLGSNQIDWMTAEVFYTEWKINLPMFTFTTIGSHLLTIESISDASNCPQVPLDPPFNSIFVDVGAGADIVSYDQREYFCAGDMARFHLEGTSPWGIVSVLSYPQYIKLTLWQVPHEWPFLHNRGDGLAILRVAGASG